MARVLYILPSSTYRAAAFLDAARSLGVDVVTGSEQPQALAGVMGDHFVELDLDDPDRAVGAIERLARRLPLDAVVAVDDVGGLVASMAAERLGLRHNLPPAVAATRDKAAMRRLLDAAGVSQPAWRATSVATAAVTEPDTVADAVADLGLPAVVKPRSLSGSRGVIRVDTVDEARAAAVRVRSILSETGASPTETLLVEEFVAGDEFALEGIVRAGALEVLALFDKPDPLDGPYFEETIYLTPSRLPPERAEAVRSLVASAVAAIGIVEGPIHAEVRLGASGSRPVLIEVAARTIGGNCAKVLRFATGTTLEELVLAHFLGSGGPARREDAASGVMMIPVPRSGRLVAVRGLDEARRVANVTGAEITIAPGRRVRTLPEGDRYLGFLYARAESVERVEHALRSAHSEIEIEIESDLDGVEIARRAPAPPRRARG